jgi:predicted transposase YdaD
VIYLKKGSTIQEPFLANRLPDGRSVHRFDFSIIRLWEVPTKELKEKGLVGLLPLLVLTREGTRREVVEDVIADLAPSEEASKADLLTLTYGLASLAFENEEDQEWLIWRFAMLDDILLETRAFQEIRKSALKEGREERREEGKLEGLREALLTLVQARFPGRKLQRLTKIQAVLIDDPTILEDLITKIALAQTLEEVQTILLDVPDTDEE